MGIIRWHRAVVLGAVVVGVIGASAAHAEPPIEDRVVAPPGAEVIRADDVGVGVPAGTASFLDSYEELDVVTEQTDTAIIHRGENRVVVTTVRLAAPDQAEQALEAVLTTRDEVEVGAPVAPGVGYRRITHDGYLVHEAARIVGSDLVVWADLQFDPQPSPLLGAAVEAHLAAFPDEDGRPDILVVLGVVVLVVAGGFVLRRSTRRPGPPPVVLAPPPPHGGAEEPVARVNW